MSRRRAETDPLVAGDAPSRKKKRQVEQEEEEIDEDANYPEGVTQEAIQEITNLLKNHVRSGKILKMILKNFMCHGNLLVDFNKRVNMLVGNNGSGKSAVLTALIIGLGSKASVTSRSSSLKHLIKNGENSCSVEIHISNDGIDAYDQATFGKKIIVIRSLTAGGASSYKLKDELGHVVSTSKNDLMKMTLCLNIQAENPVCVLNQDYARSFLKDSDPKKRYQLFLKATQIDAIIEKLNDCNEHYTSAKHQLEYQKKGIDQLKKNLEAVEDKYMKLKSVETLKVDLENHKNELNWALVKHCEKEIESLKQSLSSIGKTFTELMEELKSRDDTKSKLTEVLGKINAEITVLRTACDVEVENYELLRQEFVKLTDEKANQSRVVKKIAVKKGRILDDIKQIEGTLAERNDSYANNILKQKQENELKIKQFGEQKAELDSMLENIQRDIDMYLNTINQETDVMDANRNKKTVVTGKMTQIKAQIRQIDTTAADSLSVYGRDMNKLVTKIKQMTAQGQFSKLPRGPLGQYIQVPDKKWRAVVEQTLGNHIRTFRVNNDADRVTLDNLFRREFPQLQSTIITGKFADKVYDVNRGKVQAVPNTNLLMNLVKVSDSVVMNCLIDQIRIETILLAEDQGLATHLTADEENIPQNLSKVILLKPLSEIFPAPAYRSYALPMRQARFIQVNTTELKQQYSVELQENGQKIAAIEAELKTSQDKIANIRKNLGARQAQLKKMNTDKLGLIAKINDLKSIEYPSEHDNELLQNELEELKKSIAGDEEQLRMEAVKLKTFEEKEREREQKLKMCKVKKKQIESEIQKFQEKHDAERAKLLNLDNNKKYKEDQLKRHSEELTTKKAEFDKKKLEHTSISVQAAQYGPRMDAIHTPQELNKLIKEMEKRIRTICSSKENIADVKIIRDTQQEKLNLSLAVIDVLSNTLKTLYKARNQRFMYISRLKEHMSLRVKHKFNLLDGVEKRFKNIFNMKKHMSRRVMQKFSDLMNLRKFNGVVKIDHELQTLDLHVIPRDKDVENAVRNTKSLSGGERSYSTVSFLISLWSCVDHPFYFLDEYDVFTDEINRHVMTKLLLYEAEKKPDCQYTFLTPQDMSTINANEMITIHRMEDPNTEPTELI